MATTPDLVKAIRSGNLVDVVAALDGGAKPELDDGQGDPGLPLAIACFLGHADIARVLIQRGAKLNFADNRSPTSPLSMALRGKRTEVIRVLIELGLDIPEGIDTGLSAQEITLAQLKGRNTAATGTSSALGASGEAAHDVEEISMVSCYGIDTSVLEADVVRAAREMGNKNNKDKKD